MGKIISIILGAIVAAVGIMLLFRWWEAFKFGVKASLPAILIFGGVIALIAGLSELKDEMQNKSEKK